MIEKKRKRCENRCAVKAARRPAVPRRFEPLAAQHHRSETRMRHRDSFRSVRPSHRPSAHVVALLALDGMFEPGVVIELLPGCPPPLPEDMHGAPSTNHHEPSSEVLYVTVSEHFCCRPALAASNLLHLLCATCAGPMSRCSRSCLPCLRGASPHAGHPLTLQPVSASVGAVEHRFAFGEGIDPKSAHALGEEAAHHVGGRHGGVSVIDQRADCELPRVSPSGIEHARVVVAVEDIVADQHDPLDSAGAGLRQQLLGSERGRIEVGEAAAGV